MKLNRNSSWSRPGHQGGVNLVELMIGMVVGLIALVGLMSLYIAVLAGHSDLVRQARLNQDVRVALDFITNDIRRAGYWRDAVSIPAGAIRPRNCFMSRTAGCSTDPALPTLGDIHLLEGGSCLLLSYDATYTGASDQLVFGYRRAVLQDVGVIEMLVDPTGAARNTNPGGCGADDTPADTRWVALTDPNETNVTNLQFSTVGSRCVNVSTGVAAWTVSTEASVTPACIEYQAQPGAVASGQSLVESRTIRVRVQAVHRTDPVIQLGAGNGIERAVRVQNNRMIDVL
ncbi:hypothetical protein CKO25_12025 [Thiocapsa imhoffii]|uniref:Prepilin-type N-terminal cleavage/methylation domain-containing protein n=2 Tax=Thiocapsa imhoffii TaxID=382777 RepID=A0A9X0WIV4_9GAMM|nr:hypothetical protein [Thiocapsa imhoffii]